MLPISYNATFVYHTITFTDALPFLTKTLGFSTTSKSIYTHKLLCVTSSICALTPAMMGIHVETVTSSCVVSVVGFWLAWLESLTLRQLLTSGQETMLFFHLQWAPSELFCPSKKAFWLPESWHILLNPLCCYYHTRKHKYSHIGLHVPARLHVLNWDYCKNWPDEPDTCSTSTKSPFILWVHCAVKHTFQLQSTVLFLETNECFIFWLCI